MAGRTETGTRLIRRESEAGAGRKALYELFSGDDVLLGGLRQLVVVWRIVACSIALGSH